MHTTVKSGLVVARGGHLLHLIPLAALGGCEVNCLRVIEGLPDFRHSVVVFHERGPMSEKWEAAGADVRHLEAWTQGRPRFRAALTAWAGTAERPLGAFYWSTSRLPLVLQATGGWNLPWAIYLGNPVTSSLVGRTRLLLEQLAHRAPKNITLVACSQQVANSHRHAFYYRRFSTDVIYNAVGPEFFRVRIHRALPRGSGPRVGMVARLDAIKDHLTIIRALASVRASRDDIMVEFAGAGELRKSLEHAAVSAGVADRVHFLGPVTDVAGILAGWDVYLHSTTAAEGMGTAVAEAMTSGLPCLVSDLPVMHEVCGEHGAAYAPAADSAAWGRALLQMLDQREQREAFGRAAQERARTLFARPTVVSQYLRIIAGRGKGRAA